MEYLKLNFNPFPTVYNERLKLRLLANEDFNDFLLVSSDIELVSSLDNNPNPNPIARVIFNGVFAPMNNTKYVIWIISFKYVKNLLGYVGFHNINVLCKRIQICYGLFFNQHRNTVMGDNSSAIVNIHLIAANIYKANSTFRNLLLKNNLVKESLFKGNYCLNGVFLDCVIYFLLKRNYVS